MLNNRRWESPQTPEDLEAEDLDSHPPPADV